MDHNPMIVNFEQRGRPAVGGEAHGRAIAATEPHTLWADSFFVTDQGIVQSPGHAITGES